MPAWAFWMEFVTAMSVPWAVKKVTESSDEMAATL